MPAFEAPAAEAELDLTPAEEIPAELAEVFAQEAADHLQTISRLTAQMSNGTSDREGLQELRRAVHTLKCAAGVVGYTAASKLAHRMEDLLDLCGHVELTPPAVRIIVVETRSAEAINGMATRRRAADQAPVQRVRHLVGAVDGRDSAERPARIETSADDVELVDPFRTEPECIALTETLPDKLHGLFPSQRVTGRITLGCKPATNSTTRPCSSRSTS
jgi:chemotaxis protein histidine kinase CheA